MDYLKHIAKLQKVFEPLGYEVAVGGGIAYDAFVGKITRPHDDLDLDIVGKDDWAQGFEKISQILKKEYPEITTVKDNRIVIEKGKFIIDAEYVQSLGKNKRTYLYGDGKFTYPVNAYLPHRGKIGRHVFTIENPHFLFVIKLMQPILGKKSIRKKDVHDLDLIRPLLDSKQLIKYAQFELKYFETKFKE